LSVSVLVLGEPPVTVLGFNVSEIREATPTVSVVLRAIPYVPEIVTLVEDATPLVVMVNVALLLPAAIGTFPGTCAAAILLLCRVTTTPPDGATPFKVTVPVALFPPIRDAGLLLTEYNVGTFRVSVLLLVAPYVPEMTAEVLARTGVVVMVKLAVRTPLRTTTLAGMVATAELLPRITTTPPAGAGPLKVTVPVELFPPTTELGLTPSV